MRKIFNYIIKYSLYGLVFLMPLFFLPWTVEAFEFSKQYLLIFLVALALMAWLAKMILVNKKIVFRRTPLDLFIVAFMVIMILSAVFSIDSISSWLGFYGRFTDSVVGLLALGVMYFVVVNNVRTADKPQQAAGDVGDVGVLTFHKPWGVSLGKLTALLWIAGGLALIVAYLSVFGLWSKIFSLSPIMSQRTFNPVSGPIEGMAMFLVMLISLLVGMMLVGLKKKAKVKKVFYYLIIVVGLFLLLLVDFWAAWLSLGIVMLLLLMIGVWRRLFKKNVNLLLLPIILLIVSAVAWTTDVEQSLTRDLFKFTPFPKEIILEHQTSQAIAWQSVKESPILGLGPGTFLAGFSKYKPVEFNNNQFWNLRFDKANSQILETVGTTGILGTVSYLALVVMFILIAIISLRRMGKPQQVEESRSADLGQGVQSGSPSNPQQAEESSGSKVLDASPKATYSNSMALPLLLTWLALLVAQFVYLSNTVLLFYFWFLMALVMINWQKIGVIPTKKISFSFKKLPEVGLIMNVVLLIFLFGLVALFYLGGRFYIAEAKFNQPTTNSEESISNLEKVVNLNGFRENYRRALSQAYLRAAWAEVGKPVEEQQLTILQAYASGAVQQARLAATEISPNLVMTWENVAMIYRDSRGLIGGTLPFSLDSFMKAIELEPNNPLYYREICRINLFLEDRDLDTTLDYCQKAISLKDNYLDAHIQLALVFERKGDLEAALRQMETVLDKLKGVSFQRGSSLAGAATEVYFQLARLHFNLNNIGQAIKFFEQSVIISPNYPNARYGLALSYQLSNRLEDALIQFIIINQLVPGNQDVLGRIQQLQILLTPAAPEGGTPSQ